MSALGLALNVPAMGGDGPRNTVAPAIAATATIGTTITPTPGTWTSNPTLTYQWQRYTGGVWANIAGATTANRAPVDADFGLALRLAEIPNGQAGSAAYSNSTGLTAEAPAQTVGPGELLVNGNFAAWTGDNPDNWTVTGESGSDPMVTQVAPDGSAGVGAAKFCSSATNLQPRMYQTVLTVGSYYEQRATITAHTAGSVDIGDGVGLIARSGAGVKINLLRAGSTSSMVRAGSNAPINFVVDDATTKLITYNVQLASPSPNATLAWFFTLPGTPLPGTAIWGYFRVDSFALGNFWKWELTYTGSQWNMILYSVATFTKTAQVTANNIGACNGVQIIAADTAIEIKTTTDGGANYTSRGSVVSATYQTATGVNVIWTSDVTMGLLSCIPGA